MNILIVSPYLPHPKAGHGTGVFMYGLLKHFSPRHNITLLTFCDARELTMARDLGELSLTLITVPRGRGAQKNALWNLYLVAIRLVQLLRSIILWQPFYVSKYRHPRMSRLVRKLSETNTYDIVQMEMSQMAQYVSCVANGKTVLHSHDVSYRPAYRQYKRATSLSDRWLSYVEWCRWSLYERRMVREFDHNLCVTEQDVMLLRWLTHVDRISYFPRGVDVPDEIPPYSSREERSLLFIGTFSHAPNTDAAHWLAREIFPKILEQFPSATLYLIGQHPPAELHALASKMPGLKVLGFVENVAEYLRRCSVFIAPLRFGGGVKIKVLHAMAEGIPVVTTRIGTEGIQGLVPESVCIGDSTERLVDCVASLFSDVNRADRIGRNGYKSVSTVYSWNSVVRRLEEIYGNVIHQ